MPVHAANKPARPLGRRLFGRFLGDDRGAVMAETVIILPLIFWAWGASLVFFQAFSAQNTAQRATYTVADLISRQTKILTPVDIDGMQKLFNFINSTQKTGETTILRVSDVYYSYDATDPGFKVKWSASTDHTTPLSDATVDDIKDSLPVPALGDTEIVVETWTSYTPAFDMGLAARTYYNLTVTRPRMSPDVDFSTALPASGVNTYVEPDKTSTTTSTPDVPSDTSLSKSAHNGNNWH